MWQVSLCHPLRHSLGTDEFNYQPGPNSLDAFAHLSATLNEILTYLSLQTMLRNGVLHLLVRPPYRLAFRRMLLPPPSSAPDLDPTAIYIASDRRRFYRSVGIFCLLQASAWGAFTAYVARKSEVNWETLVADLDWFNQKLARRLESLTPSALKRLILRRSKTQENVGAKTEETATVDTAFERQETQGVATAVAPSTKTSANAAENTEWTDNQPFSQILMSMAKDISSSFRTSLGISEDKKSIQIQTGNLLSLLTGFMCIFTCFMGGLIPRRVVRRINIVPRDMGTSAVTKAKPTDDPLLSVSTYSYFGLFPRERTFQVPISQIRATAPYKEGNKFINIMITGRIFTFYVEKYEAKFFLTEFFDHLDHTAVGSALTKK
nr:unnamed protein product [Spirometra erinaceieuropaei]